MTMCVCLIFNSLQTYFHVDPSWYLESKEWQQEAAKRYTAMRHVVLKEVCGFPF